MVQQQVVITPYAAPTESKLSPIVAAASHSDPKDSAMTTKVSARTKPTTHGRRESIHCVRSVDAA